MPAWARWTMRAAGVACLAAAALHAALADEHLAEWWGYGAFFVAASIGQGILGLVLLAMPDRPARWTEQEWQALRLRIYGWGILGNAAVVALYAVTRTVGVPFLGPSAGEVEPVGPLDLPTKAAELAAIACLAVLRWEASREGASRAVPSGT